MTRQTGWIVGTCLCAGLLSGCSLLGWTKHHDGKKGGGEVFVDPQIHPYPSDPAEGRPGGYLAQTGAAVKPDSPYGQVIDDRILARGRTDPRVLQAVQFPQVPIPE